MKVSTKIVLFMLSLLLIIQFVMGMGVLVEGSQVIKNHKSQIAITIQGDK